MDDLMFDVQTCPTCDDFLPPGSLRCAACSRPDPETSDPWRSGTPEAIAAPASPAVAPAPGSPLARRPARHRSGEGAWITPVAGLVVVCLVVVAVEVGALLLPFGLREFVVGLVPGR